MRTYKNGYAMLKNMGRVVLLFILLVCFLVLYEWVGYRYTSIPFMGYYPNERDSLHILLKYMPLLLVIYGIKILKGRMNK